MRTLALIAASSTVLALAACSKEPEAPAGQATEAAAAATTEAVVEPVATGAGTETAAPAKPVERIPEPMAGRWGLVTLDCTSTKGDAKGLMTVGAQDLKFYESVAKLGKITGATNSHIRASFTFTGEGQTWTQDVVLALAEDGKKLTRRDYGPDAMPGPLEYTRCQ